MAPELDGKAGHKDFITPFDAHEQVARQPHEVAEGGLQAKEYEHQEYPKAVAHDDNGEPVIANNADHEAELESK